MKKKKQTDFEFMDTASKILYEVFWDSVREDEILKRQRIELENIDLKKENEELKHQLAKKDKIIEELKEQAEIWHKLLFEKMETQIIGVTNKKLKQIRHQVCQEIREKAFRDCIGLKESKNFYHYVISPEVLDQIEGENGDN